jgi:hypothetical protein
MLITFKFYFVAFRITQTGIFSTKLGLNTINF